MQKYDIQDCIHSDGASATFLLLIMGATAALAVWTIAGTAQGQRLGISGWEEAAAARWQRLTNQPPFDTDTALLLTDGTVMVHEYGNNNWWRLTPDINGSYLNGTWSQLASMSPTYGPSLLRLRRPARRPGHRRGRRI